MVWPLTAVATGDLVTAAQLNQIPIALAEASGAAASYDFTSIPQAWTHLFLIMSVQGDSGSNTDALAVQFNGDTAGHYYDQRLRGTAATASAAETLAQTSGRVGDIPGGSGGAFGTTTVWLPSYTVAAKHSWASLSSAPYGTSTGKLEIELHGGFWDSAAAITRILVFPAAGAFVANSVVTLYGQGAL